MKIKILGLTYEVVEVKNIDKFERTWGQIEYEEQIIKICSDLKDDKKAETLIHEILHGIVVGLNIDDLKDNENLIQSLAATLYQVLQDNKELTKILVS